MRNAWVKRAWVGGAVWLAAGCSASTGSEDASRDVTSDAAIDATAESAVDAAPSCTPDSCLGGGRSCRNGSCVDDCRPSDAHPCASGTLCDYSDGHCRASDSACLSDATFEPCASTANPSRSCGPGLQCDGQGSCLSTEGCSGIDCDATGRCWATMCRCTRPAPRCTPAPLEQLNRAEFVGSPVNGRNEEGAFALGFDDVCAAYVVTMISGPDYLRQMTADGTLTTWTSTTNLNMGEVAVLRLPGGEFSDTLGDVAATYICCATCGCIETGMDGRLGVVRLDRTSTTRPLPNVLPATPTTGSGPFGNASLDTGPYGLTWGGDRALYVGNVHTNGDFSRIDLNSGMSTSLTAFAARVVAATMFDAHSLLVALENGSIYHFDVYTGLSSMWATLPAAATSLARDRFTGRVYAEIGGAMPTIVELRADGSGMATFQTPPRQGRIAIAPDGYLYHLSVYPAVDWMSASSIVRWPLPAMR
jgi:hypothetical protein